MTFFNVHACQRRTKRELVGVTYLFFSLAIGLPIRNASASLPKLLTLGTLLVFVYLDFELIVGNCQKTAFSAYIICNN